MSLIGKKWVINNEDENLNLIAKLLKNRGIINQEKADDFFKIEISKLHDPYLLKDMDKAVIKIKKSLENNENIMIFGDYDVDGISATAILYDLLSKFSKNIFYTLPNREKDGYGLKSYFIERFKEKNINLLITVDCGTSNFKEVELANSYNIDVIITDHHSLPEKLPNASAVINPKRKDCPYPNKEICGSSIAYKIVVALSKELFNKKDAEEYIDKQLGIVSLGVISDCMRLKGENRILVKEGLKRLAKGSNPGITALLANSNVDIENINSETIGFQISPRLNAAGRLDNPDHSFELLIGNTDKAKYLNELNEKRRKMSREFMEDAIAEIESKDEIDKIIVLYNKNWHPGILGLIAGSLCERYNRPSIIMQDRGNEFIASMRSVNNFNITAHLRKYDIFKAFGGHSMAGGFTLPKENLDKFMSAIKEISDKHIKLENFINTLDIDCEIKSEEINFENYYKINLLAPFGKDNPAPKLVLKNIKIQKIRAVGQNKEHLQFPIQYGNKTIHAIAFKLGRHIDSINLEEKHDLVCSLDVNKWNGESKLQLKIIDIK